MNGNIWAPELSAVLGNQMHLAKVLVPRRLQGAAAQEQPRQEQHRQQQQRYPSPWNCLNALGR